jgi:Domain of unknown function (DUF3854)
LHAEAKLRPDDLKIFVDSMRIPRRRVLDSMIERVSDLEARSRTKSKQQGDLSGILYNYVDPRTAANGRAVIGCRLRLDTPLVKPKEIIKYLAPPARLKERHLYFAPSPEVTELYADPTVPVCLVESEKSVLALQAWALRLKLRILFAAMGGCWGWRDKKQNVLPDLAVCSQGRLVYILLDGNRSTNSNVSSAERALTQQLRNQGAVACVAKLPVSDRWNGPDDFLAVNDVRKSLQAESRVQDQNGHRDNRR